MIVRRRIRTVILVSQLLVLAFRMEAYDPVARNAEHPTAQPETSQGLPRRFPLSSSLKSTLRIEPSVKKGDWAIFGQQEEGTTLPAERERLSCRSFSQSYVSGMVPEPLQWQPLTKIDHPWQASMKMAPREVIEVFTGLQPRGELEMLLVPGGIFERGNDHGAPDQRPAHPVYLPSFEISASEVTNHLYHLFIEATGHPVPEGPRYGWREGSYPHGQGNAPVVFVNWEDAVAFCRWLSQETGQTYRLPTEAEWEKAAQVIGDRYTSVGSIWEWCQDWYDREAYRVAPRIAPQGPTKGQRVRVMGIEGPTRVIRGGGFGRSSLSRRVTVRSFFPPDRARFDLGFRIVRELGPAPPRLPSPTTPN